MEHPNWQALATVHIPYKRFVTSTISETCTKKTYCKKSETNFETNDILGPQVRNFYEQITKTSFAKIDVPVATKKSETNLQTNSVVKIKFDENKFFRAAMSNDLATLITFDIGKDLINTQDMFGWTALMMAACEGSTDCFQFLLENGADINVKDRKGMSAKSLAAQKGYKKILDLIDAFQKPKKTNESANVINVHDHIRPFYCDVCNKEFKETTRQKHQTSTVHQFNLKKNKKNYFKYSLPRQNRGLKIMVKQGWNEESGLGPSGQGHLYPIKTVLRKKGSGIGIQQDSAKVTHFKPFDLAAIKYRPAPPRNKNRSEMSRERRRNRLQEQRLRNELS